MVMKFRHQSGLRRDFNRKRERRRLIEEPNRARVEGIQELRSRPDPETDGFLGAAARDAGFEEDSGAEDFLGRAATEAGFDREQAGFGRKRKRIRFGGFGRR